MLSSQSRDLLQHLVSIMATYYQHVDMLTFCTVNNPERLTSHGDAKGCIAAFAVAVYGTAEEQRPHLEMSYHVKATELLNLTPLQARHLFHPHGWDQRSATWPKHLLHRLEHTEPGTVQYMQIVTDRIQHFITSNGFE